MEMTMTCAIQQTYEYGYVDTVLVRALKVARMLRVCEVMQKLADAEEYKSPLDWLLCRIYPKEEVLCRAYYTSEGKPFRDLHTALEIRHIDSKLAVRLHKLFKEREDTAEGGVLRA